MISPTTTQSDNSYSFIQELQEFQEFIIIICARTCEEDKNKPILQSCHANTLREQRHLVGQHQYAKNQIQLQL